MEPAAAGGPIRRRHLITSTILNKVAVIIATAVAFVGRLYGYFPAADSGDQLPSTGQVCMEKFKAMFAQVVAFMKHTYAQWTPAGCFSVATLAAYQCGYVQVVVFAVAGFVIGAPALPSESLLLLPGDCRPTADFGMKMRRCGCVAFLLGLVQYISSAIADQMVKHGSRPSPTAPIHNWKAARASMLLSFLCNLSATWFGSEAILLSTELIAGRVSCWPPHTRFVYYASYSALVVTVILYHFVVASSVITKHCYK